MWFLATFRNRRMIKTRSRWGRGEVLAYQERQFQEILRHVWANSPFYRDYYTDHGIREQDLGEMNVRDLPIISKADLMENFDRVSNDPALRRDRLEAWIASDDPSLLYDKRFVVIHTSGSSGSVGLFVYDKPAWTRMRGVASRARTIRLNPLKRIRLAWYGATHGRFAGVTTCEALPRLLCDVKVCSVLDPRSKTIAALNQFQPELLIGYAGALHELAEASLAGDLEICPTFVGTSGEKLSGAAVVAIREAWGVAPTNAYGASESLCLGLGEAGQEKITLMEDETIIEMLDEQDQEVAPGEIGRVVITALYNRAIPILRYDLGDTVTRGHRADGDAFDHILRVEGRREEAIPVMLEGGVVDQIHPCLLAGFFVPGIRQFQFISESPSKITVRYTADEEIDEAVRVRFEKVLEGKGAARMTVIGVQKVPDLPADPSTGKRRLVVVHGR